MTRTQGLRALVAGLALLLPGCGSTSGPIAPGHPISLSGTWSGTVTDSEAGEGAVRWVITQVEAGLSGTYSNIFQDAAYGATGTLAGVVTGAAASVFLTPAEPLVCSPTFAVSGVFYVSLAVASDRITGSYSTFTCVGGRAGTLTLIRQ